MYEALLAAARDGVDVRVLVPGRSDLPWISWLGRSGFAGLLQEGVRVFEWQGPMLHAKTTIVDGTWSRVGSSNLNLASLLTNWELDVLIEDFGFAEAMEKMFLADLKNSHELMLRPHRTRHRVLPVATMPLVEDVPQAEMVPAGAARAAAARRQKRKARGTAREELARAGAAVLGGALRRQFEPSTWTVSLVLALLMLLIGLAGLRWTGVLGATVAVVCLWLAFGALLHAVAKYRRGRSRPPRRSRKRRSLAGGTNDPVLDAPSATEPEAAAPPAATM